MKALALKYRPKSFPDLVGQIHAAQSLQNAIEYNKVAHAYCSQAAEELEKHQPQESSHAH